MPPARTKKQPAKKPVAKPRRAKPTPIAATASAVDALTIAATALESSDHETALRALLAAWRATRSEQIAGFVDRASRRVTRQRLGEGTIKHMTKRWLDIASKRDELDVPRLLDALVSGWTATPRLKELAKFPDDPRVAMALAKFAAVPPYQGDSLQTMLAIVHDILVQLADVRVIEVLAPYAKTNATAALSQAVANAVAARYPQRALSEQAASLAKLIADRLGPTTSDQELLAAIYANPGDDGAREVYADWLQEHGDAERGELIMLQLAKARAPLEGEAKKRERALRAKASKWLGPLAKLVRDDEWARGFVRACRTDAKNQRTLRASLALPEWSTVEQLRFDSSYGSVTVPPDLLAMPNFKQVVTLLHANVAFAKSAANGPPHGLRRLEIYDRSAEPKLLAEAFAGPCDGLPSLRWLSLYVEQPVAQLAVVLKGGLGKRLERLEILHGRHADLPAWLDVLAETTVTELVIEQDFESLLVDRPKRGVPWELGLSSKTLPDPVALATALRGVSPEVLRGLWISEDVKDRSTLAPVIEAFGNRLRDAPLPDKWPKPGLDDWFV